MRLHIQGHAQVERHRQDFAVDASLDDAVHEQCFAQRDFGQGLGTKGVGIPLSMVAGPRPWMTSGRLEGEGTML